MGSGQKARQPAVSISAAYIELGAINWQPEWKALATARFRQLYPRYGRSAANNTRLAKVRQADGVRSPSRNVPAAMACAR